MMAPEIAAEAGPGPYWPTITVSGMATHFEVPETWHDDDFLRLVSRGLYPG